jgi:CRP-like cAMP-binding protein
MRHSARIQRATLELLGDRLSAAENLPPSERRALSGLWREISHHHAGQAVSIPGDAGFILAGWACRLRHFPGGKRQIFSFFVPGDFVRPNAGGHTSGAYETICLTPVEFVDATRLLRQADGPAPCPVLAALAVRLQDEADSLIFDHMVRLGARDARGGIAHLLLELHGRLSSRGMAEAGRFALPIGQRPLGHAMGLSTAHINRTLKQLREEKLIDFDAGWVRIVRPRCLASLAAGRKALADAEP